MNDDRTDRHVALLGEGRIGLNTSDALNHRDYLHEKTAVHTTFERELISSAATEPLPLVCPGIVVSTKAMVAAANLVEIAALVGDTARATVLAALMGGEALTAMKSRWSGVLVAYGVSTASVTWATLAIAGLGFIIASLPWLLEALCILGAAYLIYLGALFFAARTAHRCQLLAQRGERTLN